MIGTEEYNNEYTRMNADSNLYDNNKQLKLIILKSASRFVFLKMDRWV